MLFKGKLMGKSRFSIVAISPRIWFFFSELPTCYLGHSLMVLWLEMNAALNVWIHEQLLKSHLF